MKKIIQHLLLLPFLIPILMFGQNCAGNLLQNPGFESGTTGWNVLSGPANQSTDAHSGTNAIKFDVNNLNDGMIQTIPATAGKTYTASFFGKVSLGTGNANTSPACAIWIKFMSASYQKLFENNLSVFTSTYSAGQISGIAPAGTAFVEIKCAFSKISSSTATGLFDDVCLIEQGGNTVALADLSLAGLVVPPTIAPNMPFPVKMDVKNMGNLASPITSLNLYLNAIQIGSFSIPTIPPNSFAQFTQTVTLAAGFSLGNFTFKATVDPNNGIVPESNELNNDITQPISVSTAPPPAGCAGNLLKNGDFENSLFDWNSEGGTVGLILESSGGNDAAKICIDGNRLYQTRPATAGKNYTLKTLAKNDGAGVPNCVQTIKFLSATYQPLAQINSVLTATTTTFVESTISKIAPANTAWVEVSITKNNGSGCVIFDDVCLVEISNGCSSTLSATVTAGVCDNNGTISDPTDDRMTFDLMPTGGSSTITNCNLFVPSQLCQPCPASLINVPKNQIFSLSYSIANVATLGGSVTITGTEQGAPNCGFTKTVANVATCSNVILTDLCEIIYSNSFTTADNFEQSEKTATGYKVVSRSNGQFITALFDNNRNFVSQTSVTATPKVEFLIANNAVRKFSDGQLIYEKPIAAAVLANYTGSASAVFENPTGDFWLAFPKNNGLGTDLLKINANFVVQKTLVLPVLASNNEFVNYIFQMDDGSIIVASRKSDPNLAGRIFRINAATTAILFETSLEGRTVRIEKSTVGTANQLVFTHVNGSSGGSGGTNGSSYLNQVIVTATGLTRVTQINASNFFTQPNAFTETFNSIRYLSNGDQLWLSYSVNGTTSTPSVKVASVARINSAGVDIWRKVLPNPGNYADWFQIFENGIDQSAIIFGKILAGGSSYTVKSTVVPCAPPTGGTGADLEVTVTADKANAPIYSNVTYTITAKNTGSVAITTAQIALGACFGGTTGHITNASGLVYAGVPGAPTKGSYNFVSENWTLTNLLPGETGVLTVKLFTLTAAERALVAYSLVQSPTDPDSQPSTNAVPNCISTQDEEAVWVINKGQAGQAVNPLSSGEKTAEIADFQLFPNPTDAFCSLNLGQFFGKNMQISVVNSLGKTIFSEKLNELNQPIFDLDLSRESNGVYFIKIDAEGYRSVVKRLIINKL